MQSNQRPAHADNPSWGRLASTVLILVGIIGGISYMSFAIAIPFGWLAQPESRVAVFLVGSAIGQLIALIVLRWLLGRRNIGLRDLGLGRPTRPIAFVLGIGFAMGYGPVVQVFVSGLAFSIAHLYAFASPAAMLLTMAYTFALAVALAILYIVGHRSLTAPIISHALINAVIQPALLLSLFTGPGCSAIGPHDGYCIALARK